MANDSDNKTRLMRWLRPFLFPFDEGEPKAAQLKLLHVAGTKLQDVRSFKVPDKVDESILDTLVTDLEQSAIDDVEGAGGMQRYVVQAIDSDKKLISRHQVRYSATRSQDEVGAFDLDSEPASMQGLLTMFMRHIEARERIDKAAWGNLINVQRGTIEDLAQKNNDLTERHLDFMGIMEEMLGKKHERELEVKRVEGNNEIKQKIGRQIAALLPAIAKRVGGVDLPDLKDPDTLSMRELLQTLNEEQLEKLQSVLTEDQMISVLSLLKTEATKDSDN